MNELLMSGVELTLLGMGIVFIFLTILVFTLHGMTWLSNKLYQPEATEQKTQAKTVTNTSGKTNASISTEHLAAMSAAVARYRAART